MTLLKNQKEVNSGYHTFFYGVKENPYIITRISRQDLQSQLEN
jgi:hypothetical protein